MQPLSRRQIPALFLGAAAAVRAQSVDSEFNVRKFGASGDGSTLDTAGIQKAIDACGAAGGGSVLFPRGAYLSGTLVLRSRVHLYLDRGCRLVGSKDLAHYPNHVPKLRSYTDNYTERSLIYAENLDDVGIEGAGEIDGQGASFKGEYKVRPYMLRFISCRDVTLRGITIRDSPMWVQHYLDCERVYLTGLTVRSRVNANNDGIDIDACRGVRIADCDISSGDDAICLKSTCERACRDVVIVNCVASSACNAIKMGTESHGGFQNIAISNCSLYDTRLSGVALEIVDGGAMNGIAVSNITMRNVHAPLFVRLGNRARTFAPGQSKPGIGWIRNVLLQGILANGAGITGCAISGIPGHKIERLTLRDINLTFEGGGTAADARLRPPEAEDKYPEFKMFGRLPAYGLYLRHVRGAYLDNVRCATLAPDTRPAMVTDDVEELAGPSANLK